MVLALKEEGEDPIFLNPKKEAEDHPVLEPKEEDQMFLASK